MDSKTLIWAYQKKNSQANTYYLSKKDINHLTRIYKRHKLTPESFDKVQIEFLLDREPLIRHIIKELDLLLKVNGDFVIKSTKNSFHGNSIRSNAQIKHEFSLSTNGRYKLLSEEDNNQYIERSYRKISSELLTHDSINKWSFGIITNGKNEEQVDQLVNSIVAQNIPHFEIIICGDYQPKHSSVKILSDVEIISDIRAPITRKKNKIVSQAKFENLFILHDRYSLPLSWFKKMKEYGNFFELLIVPNIGPSGKRVNDYIQFTGFPDEIVRFKTISNSLRYNQWNNRLYSQGGILIIKKTLYNEVCLDNRLFWGELEDVQFSKIFQLKGYLTYLDVNNKVYTNSTRLRERNPNRIYSIIKRSKDIYCGSKNLIRHYLNRYAN